MSDLLPWIRRRSPPAPEVLVAAISDSIARREPVESLPRALAEAGLAALATVAQGPGDRPSASGLLAADALLTYACEAAAEEGEEALAALLGTLTPERFESLLEDSDS